MKKQRKMSRLTLNRETLVRLGHLDAGQLGKVAGASWPIHCTLSSCVRPCPCPP